MRAAVGVELLGALPRWGVDHHRVGVLVQQHPVDERLDAPGPGREVVGDDQRPGTHGQAFGRPAPANSDMYSLVNSFSYTTPSCGPLACTK